MPTDKFDFIAPYRQSERKTYMSNNYGNEGSWTEEILHVKRHKNFSPTYNELNLTLMSNIIWTVWGDHRPAGYYYVFR